MCVFTCSRIIYTTAMLYNNNNNYCAVIIHNLDLIIYDITSFCVMSHDQILSGTFCQLRPRVKKITAEFKET